MVVAADYSDNTSSAEDRRIPAGEFRAHCLGLLDEVAVTGQPSVVTMRGRPVARVVPLVEQSPRSLVGSVLRETNIVDPVDDAWDANR